MTLTLVIAAIGLIVGGLIPLRFGVWGFLGAAVAIFAVLFGINAASGFAGASIEESLLLFNGSWVSYFGFNLQITYRAFALPLLALATPFIFRLSRGAA